MLHLHKGDFKPAPGTQSPVAAAAKTSIAQGVRTVPRVKMPDFRDKLKAGLRPQSALLARSHVSAGRYVFFFSLLDATKP